MTLLANKSGSQPETFGVLKQKLGKPNSWGFKQHFVSTTINQDQKVVEKQKTLEKKEKKLAKTVSVNEDDRNVDEKRGFVPSDVNDPTKREFLSQLSKRIFTEQRTQNLFSKLRESGSVQGSSSSSSSLLQKIMTPATNEYDTGSLKRRDPRKMFTDSSFYSAKHHPTVADQVELAHKLSSAMFNEKNKSTKGQQMFLSRVQNAGAWVHNGNGEEEVIQGEHSQVPNLKHVMNPEGRMTEWGDVETEDQPNIELMAAHAAPIPNTPDPIAESLLAESGKGEASLSRPSTFVSAYRRVFEQNRTVFGAQDGLAAKAGESPRLGHKGVGDTPSPSVTAPKGPTSPLVACKNTVTVASPNLNKNRLGSQKSVTIVDNIVKITGDKDMVEMKPVTVRIKDGGDQPTAPPRKLHFQATSPPTARKLDNRTTPLNTTTPHFIENQKQPLDNQSFAAQKHLDNRLDNQVADNRAPIRRHASFNEKSGLDNRQTRTSVWENSNLNRVSRPTDVLKTPYLLSSSNRALHNQHSQSKGNFPHIPGTSMVAKTKALFESPAETNINMNLVPLAKSRTFSSFPTTTDSPVTPLSPSVPQRCSSRKVIDTYKSLTGNMDNCGLDATSSPMMQRRIPMANFF